ncbi:MAG TPA: Maf family protein [Candidatus Dormibacteraeota bacterium]|nr:Maf family protein [Candidatus Dormibacteraeota bacterium]
MLVLGSASPRRAALLREIGMPFTVCASDVPETPLPGEAPAAFARRAALDKGDAVARLCPGAWVLAADTVVAIDDQILGKPCDDADARRMLRLLANRRHDVLTGVALFAPDGVCADALVVRTAVTFRAVSDGEIAAYVASGEPADKAGAYAIQGGAAGFVRAVDGSYSNVVGLPVDEVRALLTRHRVPGGDAAATGEA